MTKELPVRDGIVIQLNRFTVKPDSLTTVVTKKSIQENIKGNATASVAIAQTIPTLASLKTKVFRNTPINGNRTIRRRRVSGFIYYPLSILRSSTSTVALAL